MGIIGYCWVPAGKVTGKVKEDDVLPFQVAFSRLCFPAHNIQKASLISSTIFAFLLLKLSIRVSCSIQCASVLICTILRQSAKTISILPFLSKYHQLISKITGFCKIKNEIFADFLKLQHVSIILIGQALLAFELQKSIIVS